MKYIAVPEMLTGMSTYAIHYLLRWISATYNSTLFRGYIADVLALIVCVPLFANIQVFFKVRRLPQIRFVEIVLYFCVYSILYEGVAPMISDHATADWFDILAYALGGMILWIIQLIKRERGGRKERRRCHPY